MPGPGTIDKIEEHELAGVVSVYKSLGFGSRPSGILKYSTYQYYDDPPNPLRVPEENGKRPSRCTTTKSTAAYTSAMTWDFAPIPFCSTRVKILQHLKKLHPNEYNSITQDKSFGKHSWLPEIIDLKKCVAAIEEHNRSLPKVVAAKNFDVNYDSGVDWAEDVEEEMNNKTDSKMTSQNTSQQRVSSILLGFLSIAPRGFRAPAAEILARQLAIPPIATSPSRPPFPPPSFQRFPITCCIHVPEHLGQL